MTELRGAATLVRSILRRDRVRILVWIVGIVAMTVSSAAGVAGIYSTDDDLRRVATVVEGNAAAIAFNGPVQGLETLGGRVAFETGSFTLVLVGLMSLFMLSRQTRAEEESGRLELVRAAAVGRHAPMLAALVVVGGMNVVVGAALAVGFIGIDLPAAGAVTFGASVTAVGLVFAAVTAVTAQVTDNTRVASGLAGLAVGVAFAMRAVGDLGDGTLSWLSFIGWGQKMRPFAGDAWWPLAVPLAFVAGSLWLAAVLSSRRDLGGGLVHPRRGPAEAGPGLSRPVGLAVRLQRGSLVGWTSGVLALGLVYGSVANDVEEFVADLDESIRDVIARSGGSLVDSFLGTTLLILALIGSGFAIGSVLRLRSEETALRAEPVLATPVSRWRWVGSNLAVALGGAVVVLVAGGLGLGLAYGLVLGDLGQVPRRIADALVYLRGGRHGGSGGRPVRAGAPGAGGRVGFARRVLRDRLLRHLPGWMRAVSPYEHTPLAPAESVRALPLMAMAALAAALTGAGLRGFRTRDVG